MDEGIRSIRRNVDSAGSAKNVAPALTKNASTSDRPVAKAKHLVASGNKGAASDGLAAQASTSAVIDQGTVAPPPSRIPRSSRLSDSSRREDAPVVPDSGPGVSASADLPNSDGGRVGGSRTATTRSHRVPFQGQVGGAWPAGGAGSGTPVGTREGLGPAGQGKPLVPGGQINISPSPPEAVAPPDVLPVDSVLVHSQSTNDLLLPPRMNHRIRRPSNVAPTVAPSTVDRVLPPPPPPRATALQQQAQPPGLDQPSEQAQRPPSSQPLQPPPIQGADHDYALPPEAPAPPQNLPSLEDILRADFSTISYVPKAALTEWSRVLTDLLWAVSNNPEDVALHQLLLLAPSCILHTSARGGRKHQRQLAAVIKDRIGKWRNGQYLTLWTAANPPPETVRLRGRRSKQNVRSRTAKEEQAQANQRRCHRLVQDFQYSRGVQALTSRGIDQSSHAAYQAMVEKHPQRPLIIPDPDPPASLTLNVEQVKSALLSFRTGTSPGPSGLRAEHLKSALKAPTPARGEGFLHALTKFCNVMAAGKLPTSVAPFFFGASLFALNKKDGGYRPVAVGEVLRRLIAKCLAFNAAPKAAELFSPLQVGVGVKGGVEAVVHAIRFLVDDTPIPADSKWVLQLDFANAFNTIAREKVFKEVRTHFPQLSLWVESCYGSQAFLRFGEAIITGTTGLHQGDPLASFLFALALFPLLVKIKEDVPELLAQLWYLDDGTLVGSLETLQQAYDIIAQEAPELGLQLAPGKSSLWGPQNGISDPLQRGIPRADEQGFELLGSPIGSADYIKSSVDKRIAKIAEAVALLPDLEDSHVEFALLRSCLALPKFSFILRTCHPTSYAASLGAFDGLMRDSLADILGASIPDRNWHQARLPVSMGGFGLRSASRHAAAAYTVSVVHSLPLSRAMIDPVEHKPDLSHALTILNRVVGEPLTIEAVAEMSQRQVSHQVDLFMQTAVLSSFEEPREKARLGSVALPHSGDWLNAVPSKALNLHMRPLEFRIAAKYRLGLPIYSSEGNCPAGNCDRTSDVMGDHAIGCAYLGERIFRHNLLRDAIFHSAQSACLNPSREIRGLLPGTDARPADIFLPSWDRGRDTALDVTVISPLQLNLVDRSALNHDLALDTAFSRKMASRFEECRAQSVSLIPLAVETFGGWHSKATVQLKRIASGLARQTVANESIVIRHFFQKLAICLQRTNASLLISRQTNFPPTDIDGH